MSQGPASSGTAKAAVLFISEGEGLKTQIVLHLALGLWKKVSGSSANELKHDDLGEMNVLQVWTAYPGAEPYASF